MSKAIKTMLYAIALVGTTLAISTQMAWAGRNWTNNQGPGSTDGTFISTQMFVSIQSGWKAQSVWTNRGDVAQSSGMIPQGDGSFMLRADLVPTGQYNYLFFFGGSSNTAASGFGTGNTYAEPVPNAGSDMATFIAIATGSVTNDSNGLPIGGGVLSSSANITFGYGQAGPGNDGRRLLQMPDVSPGTTVYIYNHFASTMGGVANTNVSVTQGSVNMSWQGGLGSWGTGTGSPAILGGRILVYVSTNALGGPYGLTASLPGTTTAYYHGAPQPAGEVGGTSESALTQGTSYFFVFVASDTYSGATNPTSYTSMANLVRAGQSVNVYPPTFTGSWQSNAMSFTNNDLQGKPNALTPVWFKVQAPDLDYIQKHNNMVYLTPWNVNDPAYPYKIPATLVVGYVPKSKS